MEDDLKTGQAIRQGLRAEGFETSLARTGDEGWQQINSEAFDLIILDWMLPGRDGIQVLESIRARGPRPAVLLLTARDTVEDRVYGLDRGADDYLVKPFAFAELLARVRVLSRRTEESPRKQAADLSIDLATRRVWRDRKEIILTPREFDLLACLMRHAGQTVTRQMLAQEVWREPNRATPLDNVIDVHLAHLRKKIDEGYKLRLIHTIRGVGLVLREAEE